MSPHPPGYCGARWSTGASGRQLGPCTHLQSGRLRGAGAGQAARAFSSSLVEHLHVIWERVTCGSHQAEERLNQGLITVCLEGSGPK